MNTNIDPDKQSGTLLPDRLLPKGEHDLPPIDPTKIRRDDAPFEESLNLSDDGQLNEWEV